MQRYLFVDNETGGLDYRQHPLLEIGMRCETGPDDPEAVEFTELISHDAETWARCQEGALKVNHITFERIQAEGSPLREVSDRLAGWLIVNNINTDTVIWVGQNTDFDINFLTHNLGPYLEFVGLTPLKRVVNIMDLAKQLRRKDSSFRPTSLSGGNISLALGLVPEDNVHTAAGGVQAARNNFYELSRRLNLYEPQGANSR